MSGQYRTILLKIMGEEYPIKSDADADYLHELATYVEEKIKGLGEGERFPHKVKREMLAAILIADEYFTERRKNAEIEQKLAELSVSLDRRVQDFPDDA